MQTTTNILQWIVIGLSFAPAIYFYFKPRKFRNLFRERVKFKMSSFGGGFDEHYGYIVSWQVSIREITDTKRVKGQSPELVTTHRTFLVIEPEKPLITGYIPVIVESVMVEFL